MPRLVVNLHDVRPVWTIPDWALEAISRELPESWEMTVIESAADGRGDGGAPAPEVLEAIRGAEVYFGYGFPRELFEAAHPDGRTALRWVHSGAAGVGGSLYPEMRGSPIVLTNSAGIHAVPMAETVLAMVLHFARGLDLAVQGQLQRQWAKPPFEALDTPVDEVYGTTLGIVGFGGIGREVARRAAAFGMQVLALKRTLGEAPPNVELLFGEEGLRELLSRSHCVVVTVPETPETRGLIGAEELALLRLGALLVNVARGGVVDEEALLEALRARRIRAALDVFRDEPLPADSPFWDLPNVLITPHVSATSRGFWKRQTELLVDNLRRYLAGRPLRNQVDKNAGY